MQDLKKLSQIDSRFQFQEYTRVTQEKLFTKNVLSWGQLLQLDHFYSVTTLKKNTSDESNPSWLEPQLKLKDFRLGS